MVAWWVCGCGIAGKRRRRREGLALLEALRWLFALDYALEAWEKCEW
jgi:hypothetical protein